MHLLLMALALQAPTQRPDSLALARRYTAWFYAGQVDSLVAHWSADSRPDSGLRHDIRGQMELLALRAGEEIDVIEEKFVKRNGRTQYWRTARFTGIAEPMLVRWVIDPDGRLGGLGLGPLSQAPPIDPN